MTKRTAQLLVPFILLLVFAVLQGAVAAEDYLDYYEQGEFALRVQKWDRAIALFTKSIQDNPNFFVAYHNRAIAYSKKGEYDKSIVDLKKAVQLNPDYPDAYGLMGLVYEIKKDYPAALQVYQEALAREKRPATQKTLRKFVQDMEAKIKKK
ncbi:MAG: tetratricopeptide repeat protein [Desulfomonilaceae bacterium]